MGRRVVVQRQSWIEPTALFDALAPRSGFVWLDSGITRQTRGAWSFCAMDPVMTVTSERGAFVVRDAHGVKTAKGNDPFDLIGQLGKVHQMVGPYPDDVPPFIGGFVGFFGYELLRFAEPSTVTRIKPPSREGELWLGCYERIIAFDHDRQQVVFVSIVPEGITINPFAEQERWIDAIDVSLTPSDCVSSSPVGEPHTDFDQPKFHAAVKRVKEYIEAGDCYQVNIARKFTVSNPPNPKVIAHALRTLSPAPFAAYIDTGGVTLISSSPERFLKISREGMIEAGPIKGTRPRGDTPEHDAALVVELELDEKERAENIMIVDLLRNDLGRVCAAGSVTVPRLCVVESFTTLHHLTSTITGTLEKDATVVDLLRATFPCGSVTGAPKIRAMEIIDELEPEARGAYCGAMGYVGFDNAADLSVAIRIVVVDEKEASYFAGAGITWPSDPEQEYKETELKAKAIREAVVGQRGKEGMP